MSRTNKKPADSADGLPRLLLKSRQLYVFPDTGDQFDTYEEAAAHVLQNRIADLYECNFDVDGGYGDPIGFIVARWVVAHLKEIDALRALVKTIHAEKEI